MSRARHKRILKRRKSVLALLRRLIAACPPMPVHLPTEAENAAKFDLWRKKPVQGSR